MNFILLKYKKQSIVVKKNIHYLQFMVVTIVEFLLSRCDGEWKLISKTLNFKTNEKEYLYVDYS